MLRACRRGSDNEGSSGGGATLEMAGGVARARYTSRTTGGWVRSGACRCRATGCEDTVEVGPVRDPGGGGRLPGHGRDATARGERARPRCSRCPHRRAAVPVAGRSQRPTPQACGESQNQVLADSADGSGRDRDSRAVSGCPGGRVFGQVAVERRPAHPLCLGGCGNARPTLYKLRSGSQEHDRGARAPEGLALPARAV